MLYGCKVKEILGKEQRNVDDFPFANNYKRKENGRK
jgi:hypothetical protein